MNTKRSVVFSLSFVLIIFFGGLCAYAASKPSGMILFYSISCPHCKQLESFIKKNDLHKKIKFSEKEITRSRANFTLLLDIMKNCKEGAGNYVEVPLLWTGSKCLVGNEKIISFFKHEAKNE